MDFPIMNRSYYADKSFYILKVVSSIIFIEKEYPLLHLAFPILKLPILKKFSVLVYEGVFYNVFRFGKEYHEPEFPRLNPSCLY